MISGGAFGDDILDCICVQTVRREMARHITLPAIGATGSVSRFRICKVELQTHVNTNHCITCLLQSEVWLCGEGLTNMVVIWQTEKNGR